MVSINCGDIFNKPDEGYQFNTGLKQKARDEVYYDHLKTFYCECDFTPNIDGSSGEIDASNCGYKIKHIPSRGIRVEWEHIVPASTFGQYRDAWSNHENPGFCGPNSGSGRDCARRLDDEFKMMEADLHNLVPAIGELNADRSNTTYGIVVGENREYGECDFEISDGSFKVTEPMDSIHGDIARIWLYMYMTYGAEALPTSEKDIQMFCDWLEEDPVSEWEVTRNARITDIQGNSNPYVDGMYNQCNEVCGEIELSTHEEL